MPFVDAKIQMWRCYFLNTLCIKGNIAGVSALSQPWHLQGPWHFQCRILRDLCTAIKSKHPAMFLRTLIILCNSTHPHVASTSQDMLQGVGLPPIQPRCFSVLFLCVEPLRKVLKVLVSGERKMSSQWRCSGSSKSQRKSFWSVSIGCCNRGMRALLPIASIYNGLLLWPESSWMGFGSTSFIFKITRRKSQSLWLEKLGTLKTGGKHVAVWFRIFYFSVCYLNA